MRARRIPAVLVVLATATTMAACGGGVDSSATAASTTTPSSSATAGGGQGVVAHTAAACDEINRVTRHDLDGLSDPDAQHWETLAFSLQGIANGSTDSEFWTALTDLATAALTVSEDIAAGTPVGKATAGFIDAVPAVDHLCKLAGVPLI